MGTRNPLALVVLAVTSFVPACHHEPVKPVRLEFAVEAAPDAAGREYEVRTPNGEPTIVRLEAPRSFAVARAYEVKDEDGKPAVGFELTPEDALRFRAWTKANVNRALAVIVDGRVRTLASIHSELPGGGWIDGRQGGFAPGEVDAIVAGLNAH